MTDFDRLPTLPPDDIDGFESVAQAQVQHYLDASDTAAAEGFALALLNRLDTSETSGRDPLSQACVDCMLILAERKRSGAWADRVFRVHAERRWTMAAEIVERVDRLVGMLGGVSKDGLRVYQRVLSAMARSGSEIPQILIASVERWLSSV
jgi:hypothetical protein